MLGFLRGSGGAATLIALTAWMAVVVLTSLVLRTLGWARVKQFPVTLLVLAVLLLALPVAGTLRVARPVTKRILPFFRYVRTPALQLPAGCTVFPADNIWNASVRSLPVSPLSAGYVEFMGSAKPLHADFGPRAGYEIGVVTGNIEPADITFGEGGAESDRGPYRIPDNAPVEAGGDQHSLVVDAAQCQLYELFFAERTGPHRWNASSGAIFDLRSNNLRPRSWTSADAAGLPIIPGLVRYDEVKAGVIAHALRFTTPKTRKAFVWPARHSASTITDGSAPPMGERFRLKSSVSLDSFSPEARVILTALQNYGMFLADNGGPWFLSGTLDSRWAIRMVKELGKIHGSDFEALDSSGLMISSESGQALR